jgi:hypothetical protein
MVIRSRTGLEGIYKKTLLLFPYWFYIFLCIFLVNRYRLRPTGNILLDGWLNDLLCVPILLELVQFSMRIIFRKNYTLSTFQMLVSVVYCSVLFESILPKYSSAYQSDFIDIICYTIGGFTWSFYLNKRRQLNEFKSDRKK